MQLPEDVFVLGRESDFEHVKTERERIRRGRREARRFLDEIDSLQEQLSATRRVIQELVDMQHIDCECGIRIPIIVEDADELLGRNGPGSPGVSS